MAVRHARPATPRTTRWRDGVLRALALALSVAATTGVSRASTLAEAQEAFDRGQYARAAELWRELARNGEAEAAFRLGLLGDLGLGREPDPAEAFGRYLEAANQGHATAQFNVAVMLDAGTGPLWSPSAAATWYARSAAKGFARAEYNLALLYAEGDGLPRNVALARAWMSRAAVTLPAAREHLERLRALEPETAERPVAPVPLTASVVTGSNGERSLELVWTASEEPPGTRYRVELDDADGVPVAGDDGRIEVSSVTIPLPPDEPRRWRVLAVDGDAAAASDWQPLSGGEDEPLPDGESAPPSDARIAIRYRPDDTSALVLATELARGIAREGLQVETAAVEDPEIAESEVRYFFGDDVSLAREVARELPALAGQTVFRPDPRREPGTVEVTLRGASAP